MLIKGAKWQIGLLAYMPTFEWLSMEKDAFWQQISYDMGQLDHAKQSRGKCIEKKQQPVNVPFL